MLLAFVNNCYFLYLSILRYSMEIYEILYQLKMFFYITCILNYYICLAKYYWNSWRYLRWSFGWRGFKKNKSGNNIKNSQMTSVTPFVSCGNSDIQQSSIKLYIHNIKYIHGHWFFCFVANLWEVLRGERKTLYDAREAQRTFVAFAVLLQAVTTLAKHQGHQVNYCWLYNIIIACALH